MSVSFSYKYLALFTDTGHLWTGSSQLQVSCSAVQSALCTKLKGWGLCGRLTADSCLQDKLSEIDTKKSLPPKQMVWYVHLCVRLSTFQPGYLCVSQPSIHLTVSPSSTAQVSPAKESAAICGANVGQTAHGGWGY